MIQNDTSGIQDRILYADTYLAVVNKHVGEICEDSAGENSLSLTAGVRNDLCQFAGVANTEVAAVHRLDQPVSGCVLLSCNKRIHTLLSAEFTEGHIHKRYLAVVEKLPSAKHASEGILEHEICFDRKRRKAIVSDKSHIRNPHLEWKKAVLSWSLIGSGDRYDFIEIIPETGRTHQIRAQLAAAGMYIKGDLKYGARRSDPGGGIHLHAYQIKFQHPVSGEAMTVLAPFPKPDTLWSAFERLLP